MSNKTLYRLTLPLLLLALSCGGSGEGPVSGAQDGIRVVATTGMIADAAARIAGPDAVVEGLMGSGVDPHLFKASESDVRRLSDADLILYNGLHLEGKMGEILEKLARTRPVVAVAEALPETELRKPPEFAGQYDPHIWFDVRLWARILDPIVQALSELDPARAEGYCSRAEAFRAELLELDGWVEQRVAEIAPEARILVTAHDAFGYFGERYGMELVGLQGMSTVTEAGLQDVDRVVETVSAKRVKAMFVESSVPRRSIEAVQAACRARGHEVAIGGELFSDAMGPAGTPAGTYPGMVRHNVNTIVDALR